MRVIGRDRVPATPWLTPLTHRARPLHHTVLTSRSSHCFHNTLAHLLISSQLEDLSYRLSFMGAPRAFSHLIFREDHVPWPQPPPVEVAFFAHWRTATAVAPWLCVHPPAGSHLVRFETICAPCPRAAHVVFLVRARARFAFGAARGAFTSCSLTQPVTGFCLGD